MKKVQNYASIINEAARIAEEYISNAESIKRIDNEKDKLLEDLGNNQFIKVPFVGDFSAGKSSLLNAMMGTDILPTDVRPTTAVSYELYYSTDEKLLVFHKGELKETTSLKQINSLKVVAGDFVKVYINNEFIRHINEQGIVLVDMPGIDSGIEEHNNAIINYLQEGTFFFLVTSAEQGTLRNSTLRFAEELKKYNLPCNTIISKIDQKPESAIETIKNDISSLAKRTIRDNIEVGISSAATKSYADVTRMIDELNAEQFITDRFSVIITNFIASIINDLQLQIRLILSNKKDFTSKIEALKEEQDKALNRLKEKSTTAQSVDSSAEDILNDIREALVSKSMYLANLLYQSNNNTAAFNNELLSIIRPVLVNAFKRELTEYQDTISDSVREFSLNVNEILQDKDNAMLNGVNDLVGNLLGKDVLEGFLKKGIDKLAEKLVSYKGLSTLLKSLSKVLGPLVTIIINILPDLIRLIFGKSKEQKVESIRQKILSEVVDRIINTLRDPVVQMLNEQRKSADEYMENLIKEETEKYDEHIKSIQQQQQEDETTIAANVQNYERGIKLLEQLTIRT